MKKEKLILLISVPISIVIILLLALYSYAMQKNLKYILKTPLTDTKFEEQMTKLDYQVEYMEIPDEVDYITSYLNAIKENEYEIKFIIYKDEETADEILKYNKEHTKEMVYGLYVYAYTAFGTYAKYTVTSNDEYIVIIRHENTLISIKANKEYKDEINKTIKKLNY